MILENGADKVSMNTAAVLNPDIIGESAVRFGAQCILVAIDAKRNEHGSWSVYLNGGRTPRKSTPSNGPCAHAPSGPGRYCSPAWTVTAPGWATT